MHPLIKYLQEHHGLKKGATIAEAKALAAKLMKGTNPALDSDKFVELCETKAPNVDELTKSIGSEFAKALKPINDRLAALEGANAQPTAEELEKSAADAAEKAAKAFKPGVQPEDSTDDDPSLVIVKNSSGAKPDVKAASAGYRTTKSDIHYPQAHSKSKSPHGFAGQLVKFEGRKLETASEAEEAMAGAYVVCQVMGGLMKRPDLIPDHHIALAEEGLRKLRFNGIIDTKGGAVEYKGQLLRPEHANVKTIFADATSGGSNLIPQVLEDEIIYPVLLTNELTPYVTVVPMGKGTSVDTPVGVHMTLTSVANEQTAITPQSTANLFTLLNTPIHGCQGAIQLGRDFLVDTPIDVMRAIRASYTEVLANWLDEQIAVGDGAIEPLGIFNTAGTTVVPQQSPSPTGWDVDDIEEMLASLPKQYRKNNPNVRWVSTDTTYFRVRGIPVGSADQRRVFGMTHEDYQVFNHGWSVQDDVGNANLALVDLKWYYLRRKLGVEIRLSDEGYKLVTENSVLVSIRSRWGGRLLQPAAMAEFNTGSA